MVLNRVDQILSMLRLAYPQANVSGPALAFFGEQLGDIEPSLLEAAVVFMIRAGSAFFPTIAEIRRTAAELAGGDGYPSPLEAWGMTHSKEPTVHAAADLINRALRDVTSEWQLANANAYETGQIRKAFTERYGELLTERRREEAITPEIRALLESGQAVKRIRA